MEIDAAVESAAWAVLAEEGPRRLSPERIAARAGVAVTTVYRRYRSTGDVVAALMRSVYAEVPVPDTGSVRRDLVDLMRGVVAAWSPPERRRALVVAFIAAQEDDPTIADEYRGFLAGRREATTGIIARGVARGELEPGADGELVMDLLAGLVAQRLVVSRSRLSLETATAAIDAILGGIRSR